MTTWKYDAHRGFFTNKVYADGKGPSYSYTRAGRLATRTWARGTNTTYSYNNAGDLQLVNYADSTPDVNYTYDRLGRAIQVTGATTNDFTFSVEGFMLSETAVNRTWNYISQNRLGYDAFKRRSALTNLSLGIVHSYGYDAASRLQSVSALDRGVSVSYAYLTNSSLVSGLTFQQGGVTRMSTSKQFDAINRLTQISSLPSGTSAVSSTYGYNLANQRVALTNADGSHWAFGYDQLGQVTNGWRYWADGNEVLGQTFNYAFDDIGNRKSAGTGASGALRTQTYGPNLLNQYTNRTVPGYIEVSGSADVSASVTVNGATASRHSDYFRKDVAVNNSATPVFQWLTNRAVIATGTSVVSRLAAVPQTPESYTYDLDGNLLQDGLWDYTWDGENRLIRMESRTNLIADVSAWKRLDFTYDAMSRRVRKQVYGWTGSVWSQISAQGFFYDGWNLIGQVEQSSGVKLSFMWGKDLSGTGQGAGGVGGLLAVVVQNGNNAGNYFYGYDGNGNVSMLVNAADGSEEARYEYGPFGEVLRMSGSLASGNPMRFSTKYQDEETGLFYYGYRYYNASLGKWVSRDPIDEEGGESLYGFIGNNAVGSVDVLGMQSYLPPGSLPKPVPPPGVSGTVQGDLALLYWQIAGWRGKNWHFAADVLYHFVSNTGTHLNVYRHHKKVKERRDWRNAMWKHLKAKAAEGAGEIGDKRLAVEIEGRRLSNPGQYTQLFDYTFGNNLVQPFAESDELFYALHGSQYSYFGKMCVREGKWTIDLKVLLRDAALFPPGRWGLRNVFEPYAAANDLQYNHGWSRASLIYAVWDDHFDSDNKP